MNNYMFAVRTIYPEMRLFYPFWALNGFYGMGLARIVVNCLLRK